MARLRSAPSAQTSPPAKAQSKREALREKTNTTRAGKTQAHDDHGDTEELVKSAKRRDVRPKKAAQDEDELVMVGGLGREDSDAPPTTDELAKSDGPPPPTATRTNRRPPRMKRKAAQSEAQSQVLEGLKKRMEATARKEAGAKKAPRHAAKEAEESTAPSPEVLSARPAAARQSTSTAQEGRSEFSLSPSPPPPGRLSSVQDKHSSLAQSGSVLRPQSTPAVETSILALKNFKRRPRQPSMLAMVQQRTIAARPSAVNSAAVDDDPSVYDFDQEASGDEEDDFRPDAEGTPLHRHKGKRKSSTSTKKKKQSARPAEVTKATTNSAQSSKRKSGDLDASHSAIDVLEAKRHKLDQPAPATDGDHPTELQAVPLRRPTSIERRANPQPLIDSEVQVINSSRSSTPLTEAHSSEHDGYAQAPLDGHTVPSTEKDEEDDLYGATPPRQVAQYPAELEDDIPNGTMAEPTGSSPLPQDPLDDLEPDLYADPATQVTQQSPESEHRKVKKQIKPISTANLQALLPKRRQKPKPRHRKSEYDFISDEEDEGELDASHLEEHEDELGGRLRRQPKATSGKGRRTTAPSKSSKGKSRAGKATPAPRKSSAPGVLKSAPSTAQQLKATKTYSRAAAATSDKENEAYASGEDDEEDTTDLPEVSMHEVAKSHELEAVKRKFEEVDGWDMEFESMSQDDHRSSSQHWR
ncbi:hypothetical protein B0A50_02275 [Salinomyces thailandicus]|uniref:Uncharacterized protein n=1 Tax=Salinomyces thailandicus TaxID=706561 RepID=A0A4U0U8D8_9PEZI|nr:hypothetical protein B0A50_02275 [Salinomyces thailandica]